MDITELIRRLIANAGRARDNAMRAITAAKQADFSEADQLIKQANQALNEGHKLQTELIEAEEKGQLTEVTLLMVHAQDHIMNASTLKDLAVETIYLHKHKS